MKLIDLRKSLKQEFVNNNIEAVDADFIIAEVLNVKKTELVFINEITEQQAKQIRQKANLRLNNMPVEKIFKKAYFYGLQFKVDENVLSPRADSEHLVDLAIKYIAENNYKTMLDLCTGSGCLAVSIKKHANIDVVASDVSAKALAIAKHNAKLNDVEIEFVNSNMFQKINKKFDLIVSNPPYIDTSEIELLDKEVKNYDPFIALDGGELGLKFYNIIHDNLRKTLNDGGMIIMEIGEDQKDLIVSLFNDFNLVEAVQDYAGNDRVLVFKKN